MSAEWPRVKAVFQEAIERPETERAAYLAQACGDDLELRREVESLLRSHDATDPFPDGLPTELAAQLLDDEERDRAGQRLGPYRLVRRLGEGGMGIVYLAARDDDYRRQVAIKLVKRGMDTDFVLRRFRTERQILAQLDHPHIARLLDGGSTPDGLPYFVMEYIDGEPIDRYCDARKLPLRERIELVRMLCAAVQQAHRNLVVHRDIKPRNVLVSAEGLPKLLDFGIAKLLSPESFPDAVEATRSAMRLMTPEYAAPEQLAGAAITTATDVYALGVLLFELLCGRRPGRDVGGGTAARPSDALVRSPAPGEVGAEEIASRRGVGAPRLRRALRGDLDNIVLTATRAEPERRYESAQALADDLGRHLDGHPVRARPDSLAYRASRYVGRHRVAVAAAALGLLALLGGIVSASREASIAEAQRARAERRFQEVRQLAHSLLFELHDAIAPLPGSTRARHLLVRKALVYLDSLSREAAGDRDLLLEVARAYLRVGDVQGNPTSANLGDAKGALASYRRGRELCRTLLRRAPGDPDVRRVAARAEDGVGDMLWEMGKPPGAARAYGRAIELLRALLEGPAGRDADRYQLARLLIDLGDWLWQVKKLEQAAGQYRAAATLLQGLVKRQPQRHRWRRTLSVAYLKVGDFRLARWDLEGARRAYQRVRTLRERLRAEQPRSITARRDLATVLGRLGNVHLKRRSFAEAAAVFQRVLEISEAAVRTDSADSRARRDLGVSTYKLGLVHEHWAKDPKTTARPARVAWRAARRWYRRSLHIFQELRDKGRLGGRDRKVPATVRAALARTERSLRSAREETR